MFKEVLFDLNVHSELKFSALERQLIRHIYLKYLNNKIFSQQIFDTSKKNIHIRKLERNYNLRACILYFYCNPLYNNQFDRSTIHSSFQKLKELELQLLKMVPDNDTKEQYLSKDSELPVFLLYGESQYHDRRYDFNKIYQGILDKEEIEENSPNVLWQKITQLFTIFTFAIQLTLVKIIYSLAFRNNVVRRFRHIKSLRQSWKTLQTLSFQINFLVFKKGFWEIIRGKSELANLSSLIMLIGDDFIDQIARKIGSETVISIISASKNAFEIKIKDGFTLDSSDLIKIYRSLHIDKVKVNEQDSMTFEQLYNVMLDIFDEINRRLLKINLAKRETASRAISSVLNYSLSTYLDDLLFAAGDPQQKFKSNSTRSYFYKKNNCLMMYVLWLRAILLDLKHEKFLANIKEWGYLVESIQLYDDLQDMKVDWDFQPNYAHIFSFEHFPAEREWYEKNMHKYKGTLAVREIAKLSVAMPQTVAHTMLMSKFMGITHLDWFTRLATNYGWTHNWTHAFLLIGGLKSRRKYDFTDEDIFLPQAGIVNSSSQQVDLAFRLMFRTYSLFEVFENKEFYFDYLLMLCLHDSKFSKNFYIRTNVMHSYVLNFRFQFMKTGYRARLLDRFMKKNKIAVSIAVNQTVSGNNKILYDLIESIKKRWM